MHKENANHLIIGVGLIILTKLFDFSNIFLLVGIICIFDALFSNKAKENETDN